MAPDHNDFYKTFCQPQFTGIREDQKEEFIKVHKKLDKICDLLKGKNGDEGLIDEVRNNAKFRKKAMWAVGSLITVTATQIAMWIRTKISGN